MPQDRPPSPTPEKPIQLLDTPDHTLGLYFEMVSRESARFQALNPIRRGTPYSAGKGTDQRVIDTYPNGLFFCKQQVPFGSTDINSMPQEKYCIWIWSSDPDAESSYNAEISYLGESVAHPAYARVYTIRRDVYDTTPTIANGTALTGLIGIKVTAAGTGYTKDDTVNIAGAHGGAGQLVVDENGAIVAVIVTVEGTGYDSAALPAVTVTSTTGSGATLVAIVQPKTAVLVSQKKLELPDSDSRANEFVRVVRVYQTLPGPLLTGKQWNQFGAGGVSTVTTQKLAAGATDYAPVFGTIGFEDKPVDSVVKERTIETVASYDTLYGSNVDPSTRIVVSIAKTFVPNDPTVAIPNGTKGGIVISSGTSSVVKESQPYDAKKSIAITSTILAADLPAPYTFNESIQVSLPDTLTAINYLSADGTRSHTETGSSTPPYTVGFGGGYSWSGEVSLQITKGYRGQCPASITRTTTIGPPTVTSVILLIRESIGTVVIRGGSHSESGTMHIDVSLNAFRTTDVTNSTSYRAITIPPVLTPGISTSGALGAGVAVYDVKLPASSPTAIASGDHIIYDVRITELRNGIFQMDVITITVP